MAFEGKKKQEVATRTRKLLRSIALFAVLLTDPSYAQQVRFDLEAITFGVDYQLGVAVKEGIQSVKGYSGGASVRFRVHEYGAVQVGVGYGQLDIAETDPITKWDWEYWKRLYRTHVVRLLGDSAYFNGQLQTLRSISNEHLTAGRWIRKDSLYSAQLTPVQYINTLPIVLSLLLSYPILEDLRVEAQLGSTLLFFERNLFLDEQWQKRRVPDVGPDSGKAYYFSYGFRNFAPPKRGKAVGLLGGVAFHWTAFSFVSIRVGAQLESYDLAFKSKDFDLLPFHRRLLLGAAFLVNY